MSSCLDGLGLGVGGGSARVGAANEGARTHTGVARNGGTDGCEQGRNAVGSVDVNGAQGGNGRAAGEAVQGGSNSDAVQSGSAPAPIARPLLLDPSTVQRPPFPPSYTGPGREVVLTQQQQQQLMQQSQQQQLQLQQTQQQIQQQRPISADAVGSSAQKW